VTHSLRMPGRFLSAATVAIATLFVIAATPAAAKSPATINMKGSQHPYGCFLSAAASGLSVNLHTTGRIHTIKNPGGLTKLRCQFKIPAAARPKKPITKKGFVCGIFLPGGASKVTSNTRAHSTPGGNATLDCIVRM
jgi:hypothetical protein